MDDWKEARKRKYAEVVDLTQDNDEATSKPACKYGDTCYRKNQDHLRDFYHPPNKETDSENPSTSNNTESNNNPNFFFTTINDVPNAKEINKHNSIRLTASTGGYSRTNNSYDLYGISWQYRWGGEP